MQKEETGQSVGMDMLHGPMGKKILAVAVPLALTSMLQQLFNAVDIAVIGRFVGKNAMAAVGSNTSVIAIMLNLLVGLSLGANVVISLYIGNRDMKKVKEAVHTAVLVAVLGGVAMAVFGETIAAVLLRFLGVPKEILPMAVLYLRVYLIGMPIIVLFNFTSSIFRCIGDTRTPLFCLLVSGCVNVGLNLFFVLVLGMTVDGVALATVVSNAVSCGLLVFRLSRSNSVVRLKRNELRMNIDILKRIISNGLPSGFQLMLFSLSNVCIQSAVNSLGADVMAGAAAANNVEVFGYYIISSFGQACTSFVGQNRGADHLDRCRKATRLCLLQDLTAYVGIVVFLYCFGVPLLKIFNQEPGVVAAGTTRIYYLLPAWLFSVFVEVLSGSLRGYGHPMIPASISLVGTCIVRVVWVMTIFRIAPTYPRLMTVYPVSLFLTAAAMSCAYLWVVKKRPDR